MNKPTAHMCTYFCRAALERDSASHVIMAPGTMRSRLREVGVAKLKPPRRYAARPMEDARPRVSGRPEWGALGTMCSHLPSLRLEAALGLGAAAVGAGDAASGFLAGDAGAGAAGLADAGEAGARFLALTADLLLLLPLEDDRDAGDLEGVLLRPLAGEAAAIKIRRLLFAQGTCWITSASKKTFAAVC